MKKSSFHRWSTLVLIASLCACNSSDDDAADPPKNDGESSEQTQNESDALEVASPDCESTMAPPTLEEARSRLVGTWSNTDNETMCTQTYTFSALAEDAPPGPAPFNLTEAQEDISGMYGVISPEDSTELRLVLQILTDNLMPDCAENSEDDSNAAFGARLTFPSDDEISLTAPAPPFVCKKFVRN